MLSVAFDCIIRGTDGESGAYSQRALERYKVLLHAADSLVGDGGLAVLQDRGNINRLPLDRGLNCA